MTLSANYWPVLVKHRTPMEMSDGDEFINNSMNAMIVQHIYTSMKVMSCQFLDSNLHIVHNSI